MIPIPEPSFDKMFPNAPNDCYPALMAACLEFKIDTANRIADFFAQIGHESSGLTRTIESLNYSPGRLVAVFPKRFPTIESAEAVVNAGQVAIGDALYGGRLGNGPAGSGDGFKYRGRGFIQLTGKKNYEEFSRALGVGNALVDNPDLAARSPMAARIAGRYWMSRNCNELSDRGDFEGITRAINGGLNGLLDRARLRSRFLKILQNS